MDYLRKSFPRVYKILDKEYSSYYEKLKISEKMSYDDVLNYQFSLFKDMLGEAFYKTNFYNKKFSEYGITPRSIKEPADIAKIPLTSKKEVMENLNDIISCDHIKRYKGHTSGTTGSPIQFYYSRESVEREWATITYQWERIGFYPWYGRVELRGVLDEKELFSYLPGRVLRINIIKMNSTNIGLILKEIKRSGFQYIHGYPSSFIAFKALIGSDHNIKKQIKGIMLASEVLYKDHLKKIEETFPEAKIISHYGHAERQTMAAWNNKRQYCFLPIYGYTEFLGENKEIVATGFNNRYFPLIRYKTSDTVGNIVDMKGNQQFMLFPIVENINGRLEDIIYNSKEEIVPPAIITFPLKNLKAIKKCRLIQRSLLKFLFQYEVVDGVDIEKELEEVVFGLKKILGSEVDIDTERVDHIQSDASGKFRWIINELERE